MCLFAAPSHVTLVEEREGTEDTDGLADSPVPALVADGLACPVAYLLVEGLAPSLTERAGSKCGRIRPS